MPRRKKSKRGTGQGSNSQPLPWRKRREVVRNARHLDKEIPRLLYKVRHCAPRESIELVADAARELRAYRKRPKAERNILRLAALVEKVDGLTDAHLAKWRKSPRREYVESIVIALAIALFIRTFLFEPFKIPTGSMIPTLMVGDHIFVSKFIYGVRVPFTRIRLGGWRTPQRGEVIVFEYPGPGEQHGVDYIKRVMAVPGDRVWMKDNLWHIRRGDGGESQLAASSIRNNAAPCLLSPDEQCDRQISDRCDCTFLEETSDSHEWLVQHIAKSAISVVQTTSIACSHDNQCVYEDVTGDTVYGDCVDVGSGSVCAVAQMVPNTSTWPVGDTPPQNDFEKVSWNKECEMANASPLMARTAARWDNWRFMCGWGDGGWGGEWDERAQFLHRVDDHYEMEVPEGFVMVLGDNRDNSEDGRRWGLVPHDHIKGKALIIWAAGESMWKPNWKRIFKTVH